MSWLYSRALVEEYLGGASLGGEPCAPSKSTPRLLGFLPSGKTTGCWRRFQFGTTCGVLTEAHGEDLLTWFLAASLARISALREKGRESKEHAPDCGRSLLESSGRSEPLSRSLKTLHYSLDEGLAECCTILPKWGTMRNGVVSVRPTAVPLIRGSAYGSLLPTPMACDGSGGIGKYNSLRIWWADRGWGSRPTERHPAFWEWLMGWPVGWGAVERLEMAKFRSWLRTHGGS